MKPIEMLRYRTPFMLILVLAFFSGMYYTTEVFTNVDMQLTLSLTNVQFFAGHSKMYRTHAVLQLINCLISFVTIGIGELICMFHKATDMTVAA